MREPLRNSDAAAFVVLTALAGAGIVTVICLAILESLGVQL